MVLRLRLRLRVRRFTCEDASCERRTFVEQVTGLTRRHGQRTERMRSALAEVGLAVTGRAGARSADVLGARASRSRVLRRSMCSRSRAADLAGGSGVDEYVMRKGRVYGTVLVDVQTRRPVDLLPDREAATVAAWRAERPGIEVVCRDRAPFFAEAPASGRPPSRSSPTVLTSGTTSAKAQSGALPVLVPDCAPITDSAPDRGLSSGWVLAPP
ncbi:transposase [Streptomyces sp. NPDC001743]|uniref:transposase n=1 Tax=Streptomyces sp. NPDC001743 TaxID=3154397 RepID=UPI00333487B3